MFLNRVYYSAKPWLPPALRLAVRRWYARRIRRRSTAVWPILESAARKPAGWTGWPDNKQFALVLTHDVEGPRGLAQVKPLAELEMSLGFRSAFYFIPEGSYQVPPELRKWLTDRGFEVGVHDLHHDGKLFRSRNAFRRHAQKINRYLEEWQAVGFRAGFMFHQLDWFHDLNIQYDASTFDTDPFEPQPDGVHTIFPFWVSKTGDRRWEIGDRGPNTGDRRWQMADGATKVVSCRSQMGAAAPAASAQITGTTRLETPEQGKLSAPISYLPSAISQLAAPPISGTPGLQPPETGHPSAPISHLPSAISQLAAPGYVELPYTLPQDSTLFLLLEEPDEGIWTRKLDWIAEHGGMALLNIHPDYIQALGGGSHSLTIALEHYRDLLNQFRRVQGSTWHALPRQVVTLIRPAVLPANR